MENCMTEYKIDKKIPIPETATRNNYPLREMKVGDSFEIPSDDMLRARSAASWYGKRNNAKYAIRKYGSAYRCWRVE
jgi:TusA-related sulfurtransferase